MYVLSTMFALQEKLLQVLTHRLTYGSNNFQDIYLGLCECVPILLQYSTVNIKTSMPNLRRIQENENETFLNCLYRLYIFHLINRIVNFTPLLLAQR